jgi:hypothetical protein
LESLPAYEDLWQNTPQSLLTLGTGRRLISTSIFVHACTVINIRFVVHSCKRKLTNWSSPQQIMKGSSRRSLQHFVKFINSFRKGAGTLLHVLHVCYSFGQKCSKLGTNTTQGLRNNFDLRGFHGHCKSYDFLNI